MQTPAKNISAALKKPIVVIGLMGAGKTRIGGLLADALGLAFVDADRAIEAAAGCTIAEIFETQGEPAFRDLERDTLAALIESGVKVIATGGGAVMNDQTAALVKKSALSLWLKADLNLLVARTAPRRHERPLLKNGDPLAILGRLLDQRYPVYAMADLMVETRDVPAEENLRRVMSALADYLKVNA